MIEVKEISKSFDQIEAVRNISFSIKKGEIYGLLGPNGAGKSTTINMLTTLLQPNSGEIFLNGNNIKDHRDESKMILGVVPQEISLYEDLSAYDNLTFWGSLYGISNSQIKEKVDKVLELVGLLDRKDDRISTFSGGMKRRINIASSILHEPKILLMDEPTVGVDPQSRNRIFEVIEALNTRGMTIIYTTHYMEEAERLCNRIGIIDEGKLIAQGTLDTLKETSGVNDVLTINTSDLSPDKKEIILSSIKESVFENNTLTVLCSDLGKEVSSIITIIQNEGGTIESIDSQTANLEAVFLKLTGKQLRD